MKNLDCLDGDCYCGTDFQPDPDIEREEEYLEWKFRKDLTATQIALAKSMLDKYMSLLAAGWAIKKT